MDNRRLARASRRIYTGGPFRQAAQILGVHAGVVPLVDDLDDIAGPKQRKGDLRLDVRDAAVKSGAIDPGHPDKSKLWERITTHDEDDVMPPLKEKRPLSDAQKDVLRRWIEGGAPYAQHWAFIPPQRHRLDAGEDRLEALLAGQRGPRHPEVGARGIEQGPDVQALTGLAVGCRSAAEFSFLP